MIKKLVLLVVIFVCLSVKFVSAEEQTHRVISLSPAITEVMYDLGLSDILVGCTTYCTYPPAAKNKAKVGGYLNPSLEKILTLKPTCIVIDKNSGTKVLAEKLSQLKVKVLIVQNYSLDDVKKTYMSIGKAFGALDSAKSFVSYLDETIAKYAEALNCVEKKKVLFVRWNNPLTVAALGSFESELLNVVNAENIVNLSNMKYPVYNVEKVLSEQPAVIVDGSYYEKLSENDYKFVYEYWKKWTFIPAVKNNDVYILKGDYHSVPGPRTIVLINALAEAVYPEIFGRRKEYSEKVNFK